jgi:hypothetical protein
VKIGVKEEKDGHKAMKPKKKKSKDDDWGPTISQWHQLYIPHHNPIQDELMARAKAENDRKTEALIVRYKALGLYPAAKPENVAKPEPPPKPTTHPSAQPSQQLAQRIEQTHSPQLPYPIIHEIQLVDPSFTKTDTASAKKWLDRYENPAIHL